MLKRQSYKDKVLSEQHQWRAAGLGNAIHEGAILEEQIANLEMEVLCGNV